METFIEYLIRTGQVEIYISNLQQLETAKSDISYYEDSMWEPGAAEAVEIGYCTKERTKETIDRLYREYLEDTEGSGETPQGYDEAMRAAEEYYNQTMIDRMLSAN